jgi:uncharacterized membrane protein YhaH (DUF805 family)
MGFFDAIGSVFTKYATFSGRAPRSEFWWFWLLNMIVGLALDGRGIWPGTGEPPHMSMLSVIWHLAVFIPTLAVSVRRLHDTDRSGWWLLLWLVPVIGWIVLLVFYVSRGTAGVNRFGPDPLAGGTGGSTGSGYGPTSIPPVPRR